MGILGREYLMYLEKSRWRRKRLVDPASFLVVIRRAKGVSHSGEPQTTEVWLAGGEEEGVTSSLKMADAFMVRSSPLVCRTSYHLGVALLSHGFSAITQPT